ncbi:MAG: minor capsid protein [Clostridia bacterium]|nr:minor capsid protein [Clostridia bacterium]
MAGISFTIKAPKEIIEGRGLGIGEEVQKLIDSEVLKRCEPFVPKNSGALISSAERATKIGSGKVTYDTHYAAYQYYGVSVNGKALKYNGAPSRGSFWFERMKAIHGNEILSLAAKKAGAANIIASISKSKKRNYIPKNQKITTVIGLRRNPVFK